jgi:molecular chaperone DnaJ
MPTPGEPDYYSILGVSREASLEEIKQAYHRLAARFHPDLHPDDADAEACLRSLNQAYAILKDPEQRAHYNRWGAWGPPIWHPPGTRALREWMAAVMHHLLTARDSLVAHKPLRGRDLRYTLRVTPQECLKGGEARLNVANMRWCPQCLGSRMAAGKPPFPCPQCRGAREIRRPGWLLPTSRQCDVCAGEGVVVTDPCRRCSGKGSIQIMRTLIIDVPAGVRDGSRLRIQGEGAPGQWGGPAGDLYVYIRRTAHAMKSSSASPRQTDGA